MSDKEEQRWNRNRRELEDNRLEEENQEDQEEQDVSGIQGSGTSSSYGTSTPRPDLGAEFSRSGFTERPSSAPSSWSHLTGSNATTGSSNMLSRERSKSIHRISTDKLKRKYPDTTRYRQPTGVWRPEDYDHYDPSDPITGTTLRPFTQRRAITGNIPHVQRQSSPTSTPTSTPGPIHSRRDLIKGPHKPPSSPYEGHSVMYAPHGFTQPYGPQTASASSNLPLVPYNVGQPAIAQPIIYGFPPPAPPPVMVHQVTNTPSFDEEHASGAQSDDRRVNLPPSKVRKRQKHTLNKLVKTRKEKWERQGKEWTTEEEMKYRQGVLEKWDRNAAEQKEQGTYVTPTGVLNPSIVKNRQKQKERQREGVAPLSAETQQQPPADNIHGLSSFGSDFAHPYGPQTASASSNPPFDPYNVGQQESTREERSNAPDMSSSRYTSYPTMGTDYSDEPEPFRPGSPIQSLTGYRVGPNRRSPYVSQPVIEMPIHATDWRHRRYSTGDTPTDRKKLRYRGRRHSFNGTNGK